MTARAVIAHISDLHFGNHDENILKSLRDDLLAAPRPNFVLVTGDLSETAQRDQLDQAKRFLDDLIGDLNSDGHNARYVVIPGNHDVSRVIRSRAKWDAAFKTWGNGSTEGICKAANLFEYYLKKKTNGDTTQAGSLAGLDSRYCEYYPDCQLAFLKVDSNLPMSRLNCVKPWQWPQYANGRVGPAQIETMKDVLKRYQDRFPAFLQARKIALLHHHVHFLPCQGSDRLFLMEDAGPFWRMMIEWGVELILHGHKHYATHMVIRYITPGKKTEEREVMIMSAGTATSKDHSGDPNNSYYKIDVDVLKCRSRKMTMNMESRVFSSDEAPIVFRKNPRREIPDVKDPMDEAAFDSILVPDDDEYDDDHYYTSISYEATIDKDLGYTKVATYEGRRLTNGTFLKLSVVVINAPSRMKAINPTVTDLLTNQALNVVVQKHPSNINKLVFRVTLPAAKDFKIQLKAQAGSLMNEENDFDAVGLLRFLHGPDCFSYVLKSERKPDGLRCFSFHRAGLGDLEVRESVTIGAAGVKLYTYEPVIERVVDLDIGLLCHYHRLLPLPVGG